MRYLILSDIHANLTALDAALGAAKGQWDKVLCLGDVVGYGPDPNEVVDRIREIGALTIRGNHDKAGSGLANADDFNPVARAVRCGPATSCARKIANSWSNCPPARSPKTDSSMVHGAFRDEDEYVFAPAQALDSLLDAPAQVTFFGHTHLQGGFTLRDDEVGVLHFKPAAGQHFSTLAIEDGTTYLLNPGSVGQPRDGDTRAGLRDRGPANKSIEFWRVPYDIETVQKRMGAGGLPEPLIQRLAFGR